MEDISYRKLSIEECECINEMNPSQYIGRAWREIEGKRKLVEINYQDFDWPNGYEHHYNNLKDTILNGGSASGVNQKVDHRDNQKIYHPEAVV